MFNTNFLPVFPARSWHILGANKRGNGRRVKGQKAHSLGFQIRLKQPMFKFSSSMFFCISFLSITLPVHSSYLDLWKHTAVLLSCERQSETTPVKRTTCLYPASDRTLCWRENNLHGLQEAKLLHVTGQRLRTKWMIRCKPRVDITDRCNSHVSIAIRPISVIKIDWDNRPQLGAVQKQNMNFEHDPILWRGWIWKGHLFLY